MMDHGRDIEQLLFRRLQGLATDAENLHIEAWAAELPKNREILTRLDDERALRQDLGDLIELVDTDEGRARLTRMERHIRNVVKVTPARVISRWVPYAAALVLLLSIVMFMWEDLNQYVVDIEPDVVNAEEVLPGGNRAVLTLADGRTITLDEAQDGIVIGEGNIAYNDGSMVLEQAFDDYGDHIPSAVLATPKGGTYNVQLPDGSKVWLNAASTLTYPIRFGGRERVVELEGEAYFEVSNMQYGSKASEEYIPFKVVSNGQVVEVLGTAFNIAAYSDESEIRTTLVEGSVQIVNRASSIVNRLQPGEQALVRGTGIETKQVDVFQHIAWKEGYFYFNGDSPQDAFAQLSRWYDIEVIYRKHAPTLQFFGRIERDKPLGSLLKILERAGLEFEIKPQGEEVHLILGSD